MKSRKIFLVKMQKALEAERSEIVQRLQHNAENKSIDFEGDDTDIIQAQILALATAEISERNKHNLVKIENGLRKIQDGTFGLCDECAEEISEKRLIANPSFVICVSCAEEKEMAQKRIAK